ncbi:hypothetical protein DY000_02022875 [Brassica cretica]|uniref:Uncharacterized protein n=1 Tax=Brassica cretica TaxID=69181 RepID=A0ABQ7ELA2_BRACR|nr:hypothetical protein DY000_02022875 [Brassica cretica]
MSDTWSLRGFHTLVEEGRSSAGTNSPECRSSPSSTYLRLLKNQAWNLIGTLTLMVAPNLLDSDLKLESMIENSGLDLRGDFTQTRVEALYHLRVKD